MKTLAFPTVLSLLSFLSLGSVLTAQQGTSPAGYLAKEANDSYPTTFGYYGTNSNTNTYYTVIDATNTGPKRSFHTLSLRRDGAAATDLVYGARTVTMAIRMAHGDYARVANNDNNPEASLLKSAWSNVFTAKAVSLPNWATAPVGGTAPFNLKFPLDVVFPYNGADALVLQFKCTPSNLPQATLFPIDGQEVLGYSEGAQTRFGVGCIATGRSTPMAHSSYLHNFGSGKSTWQLIATQAPANAPALFFVGSNDPDAQVGACARLRASPLLVLSGVVANASGFASLFMTFPHQNAMVGATLHSQAIVFDVNQAGVPFALSDGVRATYPANPVFPQAVASGLNWTSSGSFPTSVQLFKGTSMIIGLGF